MPSGRFLRVPQESLWGPSLWRCAGLSTLLVASTYAVRAWLAPLMGLRVPYMLFLVAVTVASRVGGRRCGLLTTVLSALVGTFAFASPRGSFLIEFPGDIVSGLVFLLAATVVVETIHGELRERLESERRGHLLVEEMRLRATLEAELAESRRLTGLGTLAGGIAHDFNNLLAAVLGAVTLLESRLPEEALLKVIETSAVRGASLTQRLLALARRRVLKPSQVNLNEIVRELVSEIDESTSVVLQLELEEGVWAVYADRQALCEALRECLKNSLHPAVGTRTLRLRTANLRLTAQQLEERPEIEPGDYATICIVDDGQGMDEETAMRVFDPYFTTESPAVRPGLGAAVAYATIKQLGGHITLSSARGQGTSIEINLPRIALSVADSAASSA